MDGSDAMNCDGVNPPRHLLRAGAGSVCISRGSVMAGTCHECRIKSETTSAIEYQTGLWEVHQAEQLHHHAPLCLCHPRDDALPPSSALLALVLALARDPALLVLVRLALFLRSFVLGSCHQLRKLAFRGQLGLPQPSWHERVHQLLPRQNRLR
eukprot:3926161-Rhodomonas_salina.4